MERSGGQYADSLGEWLSGGRGVVQIDGIALMGSEEHRWRQSSWGIMVATHRRGRETRTETGKGVTAPTSITNSRRGRTRVI